MFTRLALVVGLTAPLAACSSSAPPRSSDGPTPVQQQMYSHFQAALELRAGALFGDAEMLASAGARLATEPVSEELPAGSERFVRQMREAAVTASEAPTDSQRRRAAANVARSCGTCHKAYQVGPDFVVGGPVPGETLGMHMARQSRVSRLLWDGLIGPSEETWAAGAAALAEAAPFPREIVSRVQDTRVLEDAQQQLRILGTQAGQTTDPDERAQVLARVWGVCAGCHQLAGALGPDR